MSEKSKELSESISVLVDELLLARRWARPSILISIYRSEFVRADAESMLAGLLSTDGQAVCSLEVDHDNFDVPLRLVNMPGRHNTVFMVQDLRRGGGRGGLNAYRALNLRRELLVDGQVRAVFWLAETEAKRLARHAPDFWAFRHRVVSLVDVPVVPDMAILARLGRVDETRFLGEGGQACLFHFSRGDVDAGIAACRESLNVYRQNAGLWALLGTGLLALGRREESERAFRKALRCGIPNRVLRGLLDSSG